MYLVGMKDEWVAVGAGTGGAGEVGTESPVAPEAETDSARERDMAGR